MFTTNLFKSNGVVRKRNTGLRKNFERLEKSIKTGWRPAESDAHQLSSSALCLWFTSRSPWHKGFTYCITPHLLNRQVAMSHIKKKMDTHVLLFFLKYQSGLKIQAAALKQKMWTSWPGNSSFHATVWRCRKGTHVHCLFFLWGVWSVQLVLTSSK